MTKIHELRDGFKLDPDSFNAANTAAINAASGVWEKWSSSKAMESLRELMEANRAGLPSANDPAWKIPISLVSWADNARLIEFRRYDLAHQARYHMAYIGPVDLYWTPQEIASQAFELMAESLAEAYRPTP